LVLVDRKVEQLGSDLVGLDNPAAVEMAVAHLEERGHRDVLLVTEPYDGTRSLRELKCNRFEGIGLIVLDDLDWYPLVGSGITALAQPTEEIGASAFECLSVCSSDCVGMTGRCGRRTFRRD
jgi:DNA-binding LacI/PurR family transcriptional regulator